MTYLSTICLAVYGLVSAFGAADALYSAPAKDSHPAEKQCLASVRPADCAFFTAWAITDNYEVRFSGSGAEGTFRGLTGDIRFDPEALEQARFEVAVDARTIDTGNRTKNKHARGSSWFDVEQYPEIRFRSSRIERTDAGYRAVGTLTLHGVAKEISFPFTFRSSGETGVFAGTLVVDRQEFGIKGPFLGFVVGDEFEVSLRVPVRKQ